MNHTDELLHTEAGKQRNFYTQKLLHTEGLLHTEAFTHGRFYTNIFFTQKRLHTEELYTEKPLHREVFTQRSLDTEKLLHTEAFTEKSLYTEELLHTEALHTDAFTQRSLYTRTRLHREAFTNRSFYTKKAFAQRSFYKQILYTRSFYTQRLVRKETFTHWKFYTQRSLMGWILAAYDASTAYLQEKGIDRLLILRAPYPPPLGVRPGTLFRAKGGIYGTKDAGRSWWKKLAADAKLVGCFVFPLWWRGNAGRYHGQPHWWADHLRSWPHMKRQRPSWARWSTWKKRRKSSGIVERMLFKPMAPWPSSRSTPPRPWSTRW